MNRWNQLWNARPTEVGETDFFRQVGKTVGGRPLTDAQFRLMIDEIAGRLELAPGDRLLDLCCGNGVLTRELAARCSEVVGVDFSRPLIETANKYHRPANVHYQLLSVLDVQPSSFAHGLFDKVLLYDALQHFQPADFGTLLTRLSPLTTRRRRMLFGGIPDRGRRWRFYDSPRKKALYVARRVTGRDLLGTWWDRRFIDRTCARLSLGCQCLDQAPGMYNGHFRFDVVVW